MDRELTELVQRFGEGDVQAFAEIVKRFRRKIYQVAYHIVRNHLDADEVVQETFVRLYKKQKELQDVKTIASFLIRIASNYAIDLLRRQKGHGTLDPDPSSLPQQTQRELSRGIITPGESYQNKVIMEEIYRALDTLPPRQRLTAVLHDVEGYSKSEVAQIMGCPEATVRSNLHIARQKLKKILKKRLSVEE